MVNTNELAATKAMVTSIAMIRAVGIHLVCRLYAQEKETSPITPEYCSRGLVAIGILSGGLQMPQVAGHD